MKRLGLIFIFLLFFSIFSSSISRVDAYAQPEPVLKLHMNETEGSTAYDSSGNGYDGTIFESSWVSGVFGNALNFDGTDDYVTFGDLELFSPTGLLTSESILDDGVWCWFADPRAIYHNGVTYFGYVDLAGNICISAYNHTTELTEEFILHEALQIDDHANPAVFVRTDGKLLAVYSMHGGNYMYWRVSTNPEDVTAWEAEEYFGGMLANPHFIRKGSSYFLISKIYTNQLWMRVTADGIQKNIYSESSLALNEWNHIVGTYDGSHLRIYIDGVLDGEPVALVGAVDINANDLIIGAYTTSGEDGNNFKGIIDEVRVYDRALDADEVMDHFLSNDHSTVDLVLDLPLNETVGDVAYDQTVYENNGTVSGAVIIDGKYAKARSFDGVDDYITVPDDDSLDVEQLTLEMWMYPEPETEETEDAPYDYPKLVQLDNGETWLFYRGSEGMYVRNSTDYGSTWTNATCIGLDGYFKIETDGSNIYIAVNEGHPQYQVSPLYFIYYTSTDKTFRTADGTSIGDIEDVPFTLSEIELLNSGRTWIWDIALDSNNYTYITYVDFPLSDSWVSEYYSLGLTEHDYRYMRWTGTEWIDNYIVGDGFLNILNYGGNTVPQPAYSGGIALDHDNPSIVYISKEVSGKFQIFNYTTTDGGETWENEQLTYDTEAFTVNMRPVVVRNHASDLVVMWMYGYYSHYLDYNVALRTYPVIDIEKTRQIGYTPMTFSVWMYPETDASSGYTRHIIRRTPSYYMIMERVTQKFICELQTQDVSTIFTSINGLTLNEWNHISFTYDGMRLRLYIDGELDDSTSIVGIVSGESGVPIYMGCFATGGDGNNFDGMIDEFRIYDTALSQQEIDNLYNMKTVTVQNGTYGTASPTGTFDEPKYYDLSITATPENASYLFNYWQIVGSNRLGQNPYTLTFTKDMTVYPVFKHVSGDTINPLLSFILPMVILIGIAGFVIVLARSKRN